MKICIVGTGYVGLVTGTCFAEVGTDVTCVDVSQEKIDNLKQGILPIYEPGLEDLLKSQLAQGYLTFTTDFSAAKDCDIHFLCVGTPQMEGSLQADLSYLDSSVESLLPIIKDGSLIVGKSTVPVGTAQRLREKVLLSRPACDLAWNPEFLREGFAVEDTLRPNRLVIGVTSDRAEELLKQVYAVNLQEGTPWVRANLPTAELVKVSANSFLATKISFINAMAEICETAGGDVTVLAKAIGYDPRIGNRFLQAGIGFGGGCLPKDIRAFMARAEELGASQAVEFLKDIDAINLRARKRVINVVEKELGIDLKSFKIAVLGATFKPDSDDVRDSPALDIAAQIHAAGAQVTIHDPKGIEPARKRFPALNFAEKIEDCVAGADLILHLTEWKEYRELDPAAIKKLVKQAKILDGRNMLDRDKWRAAGWDFHALGRA